MSDRLTEIATRAAAATKGPWKVERDEPTLSRLVCNDDRTLEIDFGYLGNNTQPDAEFVAHAREDVPWLLAELEKYVGHEPTVAEEMQFLRRCFTALGELAGRLEEMASEQDRRADMAPLGILVAVNDGRARTNRAAARAIKAALTTGYLPHDLMTDAELEQHGPAGDGGAA
jgi:hypothetical protein